AETVGPNGTARIRRTWTQAGRRGRHAPPLVMRGSRMRYKLPLMSDLTILPVPIASDLGAIALEVRRTVFIVEQNVPETVERDAYDADAVHLVAIDGGDVVGTLRIVFLPEHAKFGRVGVLRRARGKGIATRMMQAAMEIARAR